MLLLKIITLAFSAEHTQTSTLTNRYETKGLRKITKITNIFRAYALMMSFVEDMMMSVVTNSGTDGVEYDDDCGDGDRL